MLSKIKEFKLEIIFVLIFVLTRLPDLGHDVFNTDVWKWKARSYDFSTGVFTLDFEKTIQKYHPGVTLMWIGTAAIKVYNFAAGLLPPMDNTEMIFGLHFVQKLFVVKVIAIALAFSLYVLRKLFGQDKALLLATVLIFEPFYIALTRVFHLEGLMSTFMLASFLWLYYYTLEKKKKSRLIISAFFAGLAFLTKTSALFMFPYAGLILLIEGACERNIKKVYLKRMLLWVGVFLGVFVLIWPAMWALPGKALAALYRGVSEIGIEREHVQFYFGKLVEDPGPFYYFVVLGLRSSLLLLGGLSGLAIFWKKVFSGNNRKFLFHSLLFVLFYLIQLSIPSKKLDRYILPDIMVLSLLSTFFWIWAVEKIKSAAGCVKYIPLLMAAVLPAFYLHPDYFSYYNPALGGLSKGINILEPKWMIGGREVVNYFADKMEKDNFAPIFGNTSLEEVMSDNGIKVMTVGFPEKYYTQIHPFFREIGAFAVIQDLTPFAVKTKYFVYPVWDDTSVNEDRFGLEYEDSIYLRGVEVYKVYKRVSL